MKVLARVLGSHVTMLLVSATLSPRVTSRDDARPLATATVPPGDGLPPQARGRAGGIPTRPSQPRNVIRTTAPHPIPVGIAPRPAERETPAPTTRWSLAGGVAGRRFGGPAHAAGRFPVPFTHLAGTASGSMVARNDRSPRPH
jgi:hypothetical protein